MARHDYRCVPCRQLLRNQYRSVQEGGQANPPFCPVCQQPMAWIVPRVAMDLRSDGEGKSGHTFQKFTVRDGLDRLVEIDSLHKLREVERESEKMAADGIGQPIRFRGYAQDHSNMSENTFGEAPSERPSDEGKRKFGRQGALSSVEANPDGSEPDYSFGPGVNDGNTSALEGVN